MPVLSIGGPPGSGTTTVARTLRDTLGLRYVYAGQVFRKMAEERGMSLADFGAYVNEHPRVDLDIEMMQVEEARRGDVILEGRVTGFMLHREGVESFRVWVTASEAERARRVADREGDDLEAIVEMNRVRELNEAKRYLDNYGFDIRDTSYYDLVVDSTSVQPAGVSLRVAEEFQKRYPDFEPRPAGAGDTGSGGSSHDR